ncbi:hypothetical protein FRACYDRAFT_239978 [Fragilariopsis cylindrus CCMP1102]|uniref:RanBP2-type domain-containing protein n=1 Tax=Fragilariopsis cylindrus CCMP1102 TaxID=635003 RepID=A0A1E7FAV8_9STRA|nr:hypothetical protein FRACYDRAFT_239978 [Fragilariopsis cylindrus CCMP1102]|eukprot:OEU15298.1 hypothetical protein FRACYDRAFT_239978 [Fragilariopsis cylindrus CCMP1102]
MSSTPLPPQSTKKTPAKTPSQTWGNVLFGFMSTKKPVKPSPDSTTESRRRSSSKSNKNLERVNLEDNYNNINGGVASQFSNVSSPDAAAAAAAVPGVSFGASPLPLQQLQKDTTRPVARRSATPWKSERGNNSVQFDMGIAKPKPSRDRTRRHGNNYTMSKSTIAPVNRRTRIGGNKYKPSITFGIGKRRNRGGNNIDVSAALKNVRSAIEPSNQKIQADNNYRNNVVCRPGSRLLDQQRSNGRLPDEQQHRENTNGKREIVNDDQYQSTTEVARKKRRVGFNNEESNDTSRDLVKAKRPASKTASKKYDSDEDKEEDFTIMPASKDDLVGDYKNWSTSDEREKLGEPIVGDFTAPDCFMLKPPVSLADTPRYNPTPSLPQFRQLPLAERTDRTVPDEDDDCDDQQDTKRSKIETWKCDDCGFANADDETYCQFVKVEENKQKNQREKKCLCGRSGKEPLGWGNSFGAILKQQQDRIKCKSCGVFNEKSRSKCASCEVNLPTGGTGSTNGTSTATATGAAAANSKVETAGSIGTQGFSFGASLGGSTTTTTGAISSSGFSFGGSRAAVAAPSSTDAGGAISLSGFSFAASTTAAPAPGAISSTGFSFSGSTAPTPAPAVASSTTPSTTITSAGGFSFGNATTVPPSSATPVASTVGFQFGAATTVPAPVPASTTAPSSSPPASSVPAPVFNFGSSSTSAPPTTAPPSSTEPNTTVQSNGAATLFGNFAASSSSAASTVPAATTDFNTTVPSLGSVTTEGNDGSSKKKRRGRDDTPTSFGTTSSSASSSNPLLDNGNNSSSTQAVPGMFGNLTSAAPSFQGGTTTSAPASQPFVFGKPSTDSSNQNETSSSAAPVPAPVPIAFGNTLDNNSTVPAPAPSFPPPASESGLFGSTPASSAPINFGSTPAAGPTFGSTGPAPATTSIQFGSTPAPAPNPSFGSAVPFGSTTPAQSSTTFGSTPAPAQQPFANSTPVPGQQFGSGFGSTPAPALAQPFGNNNASGGFNTSTTFGIAQSSGVSAPLPFGGTAPTPGMGGFGGGTSQTPGMGGFGGGGTTLTPTPGGFGGGGFGQQAPPQQQAQAGGFGHTTPNAPPNAQAGGQFSLGTGGNTSNRGRTPATSRRRIVKARRPR